ncbi:uncharacterized protein LOC143257722 isoform X2 [Tachypleus tridentatus]|uniref:uncharacterized protein LOC143257722 isoform X2 n=1 Tax=Tachypleus tridentatus TaxID=6853 RepID=UPI003FCEFED3
MAQCLGKQIDVEYTVLFNISHECIASLKATLPFIAFRQFMMSEGNSPISSMQNIHHCNKYDGKIAGLYDLGDAIGRGHFAVVKLARHVFTGENVAVKVIDKTKLDDVSRAHLFQEVRCMKLVQHPNVVRLYEVIDTHTKLYLILELGDGGDMYDYIMKHDKGVDEETTRKFFQQIVHAISYCHRLHVVHRDLKPENVIFFEKLGMVKLTDFGFSNRYYPGQKLETSCGSLAYSAPEILLGDSYDAPKVDVWSMGVILYMLVCGHAPFQEANDSETLTMIMDCKYSLPSHVSHGCSKALKKNEYNHITATYFLLAERTLRGQRQEKARRINRTSRGDLSPVTSGITGDFSPGQEKPNSVLQSLISPRVVAKPLGSTNFLASSSFSSTVAQNGQSYLPIVRKCSVVREEDDGLARLSPSQASVPTKKDKSNIPLGSLSTSVQPQTVQRPSLPLLFHSRIKSSTINPKLSPVLAFPTQKFKTLPSSGRGLHAVKSSPQLLLNEIDEEVASDTEPSTKTLGSKHSRKHFHSGKHSPHSVLSHAMFRLVGQRSKTGRSRTTSCSSSEASDDDGEGLKRKMGKLKSSGRRDSSEDRSGEGSGGSGRPEPGAGTSHGNVSRGEGGGQSSVNNKSGSSNSNSNKSQNKQNEAVEEASLSVQPSSVKTTVLSTDSTDSLDIEQCLTSSVSCDDLLVNYSEDNQLTTSQDTKFQDESRKKSEEDSLFAKQEGHGNLTFQESSSLTDPSNKIPLSLSLNTGFTLLQHIENLPLYSKTDSKSAKKEQGHRLKNITHGLTQLVHSATKLDIGQNGWREHGRSKSVTRNIQSLENECQVVVDTKLSSKCCTLC